MFCHGSFLFLSLTAFVRAAPPSNGSFRITDFESRSVDLHNASPVDFDPIQSFTPSAGDIAQNWLFQPTGAPNQFRISNAGSLTFASYTNAPIAGNPNRAQVCAHPDPITLWNITANGNSGFSIRESQSGLAITAWQFQPALALATSPLTLETFDPTQPRQTFTLQTFV
ncbi:hypothetical protein C8R47DRAFT_1327527 [Mycena vitilis]|nr:hypothetical protein C8R47DRAFT_1327527 [Mycena vitilis]